MGQTNDFSIFLIIFNGLVTLVITFGFFTVKSIFKKIDKADQTAKEDREYSNRELVKLTKDSGERFAELIEKQGTVKAELIKEQNTVKDHVISQQTKIKEELMGHYAITERGLTKAINDLNITLEKHIAKGL